jgi:hypothetical protein
MELTGGVISTEHALFPDPGLIAVGLIVVGGAWLVWPMVHPAPAESEPVSAGSLAVEWPPPSLEWPPPSLDKESK